MRQVLQPQNMSGSPLLGASGCPVDVRRSGVDAVAPLAQALHQVLGESGANVIDVEHSRTGRGLHLDEVQVELQLETRSRDHGKDVLAALDAASYAVRPG